jgi:hypothetical protein
MAHICYTDESDIPEPHRIPDNDNILRIHGVNSRVMKNHYDLYRSLMIGKSPLTRAQREMIAVVVSSANACRY